MKTKLLKNVAIRVDAAIRIGTGHVMRCLTLAKKLQQKNIEVIFLCKPHKGNLIGFIKQQGFKVIQLSQPIENIERQIDDKKWLGCSYQQDAQEVTHALANYPWLDWLIIDHYSLDHRWEKLVKPLSNKVMVIDDLANRTHYCDILLDQTFARDQSDYLNLVPQQCKLLTGKQYMLLRDEFAQKRKFATKKRQNTKNIKQILITLGGTDADNIAEKLLCWLITFKHQWNNLSVVLVASSKSVHINNLLNISKKNSWIKLVVNPRSMSTLMTNADIAIGSCGATAWERCCLGLPTLAITSAKNQQTITRNLTNAGAIISLGWFDNLTPEIFTTTLLSLINSSKKYQTMVKKSLKCCDGLGTTNVMAAICH